MTVERGSVRIRADAASLAPPIKPPVPSHAGGPRAATRDRGTLVGLAGPGAEPAHPGSPPDPPDRL